jgi:hypothetical protein
MYGVVICYVNYLLFFKGILKLVLTYIFSNSWRRLFLFNLIVKTIQKYYAL